MPRRKLDIYTDASGDGEVYSDVLTATLTQVIYAPLGKSSDLATGFTVTVVTEETGRTVWSEVVTGAKVLDLVQELTDYQGMRRIEADRVYLQQERLKFTVSDGGQLRHGVFYVVYVGTPT